MASWESRFAARCFCLSQLPRSAASQLGASAGPLKDAVRTSGLAVADAHVAFSGDAEFSPLAVAGGGEVFGGHVLGQIRRFVERADFHLALGAGDVGGALGPG